jgi:hypothetical protein
MWCLTADEATDWCKRSGFAVEASGMPSHGAQTSLNTQSYRITAALANNIQFSQHSWFSDFSASSLEPYDTCLMWVTQSGIWSPSENWHLFYRLRETYGERRQLHEAPGHIFLKHEKADLATFIGLALLNGWDFHLLPNLDYMTGFVSHDGFLHLYTENKEAAISAKDALDRAKIGGTLLAPKAVDDSVEKV